MSDKGQKKLGFFLNLIMGIVLLALGILLLKKDFAYFTMGGGLGGVSIWTALKDRWFSKKKDDLIPDQTSDDAQL